MQPPRGYCHCQVAQQQDVLVGLQEVLAEPPPIPARRPCAASVPTADLGPEHREMKVSPLRRRKQSEDSASRRRGCFRSGRTPTRKASPTAALLASLPVATQ